MIARFHTSPSTNHFAASGFTLVELLVILLILSILTGLAVQSVEGIQDQKRRDSAILGLKQLEESIVGVDGLRLPDGTPLVTGFVADLGRLPTAIEIDGRLEPAELWDNPAGLAPFAIRQAVAPNVPATEADPEIFVPCGWRGPYLRLPPGSNRLLDGWGNPYQLLKPNRSSVAAGEEIAIVRSAGADFPAVNTVPSGDYREDLYLNFRSDAATAHPATPATRRIDASPLQVVVKSSTTSGVPDPAGGPVIIRYFGPDPVTGGIKVISSPPLTPNGTAVVTHAFNDPAITVGPRVLRAYQVKGSVVEKRSAVLRVVLQPAGNIFELELR